jgi:ABC-2 type transport system ATP-binding protein
MAGDVREVLINEDIVELGASGGNQDRLPEALANWPGVRQVRQQDGLMQVFFEQGVNPDTGELNRFCFEKGIVLNHLQLRKRSLESKFMELTKETTTTVKNN